MTTKKWTKLLAFCLAILLLGFILFLASSLLGNPVSLYLARRSSAAYLQDHFPGTDFVMEKPFYNFKFGEYSTEVSSPSSVDTHFSIVLDLWGNVRYDTYDSVEDRSTTAQRLSTPYWDLVKDALDSPDCPFPTFIGYGDLAFCLPDTCGTPDVPDYAIPQQDLVLDRTYDIHALGKEAGTLTVYAESDTVTPEHAAQLLLELRAYLDQKDVPFRAIHFTLEMPKPEDGPRPDTCISTRLFPYEDIYEEGLVERIQQADDEYRAWFESIEK